MSEKALRSTNTLFVSRKEKINGRMNHRTYFFLVNSIEHCDDKNSDNADCFTPDDTIPLIHLDGILKVSALRSQARNILLPDV